MFGPIYRSIQQQVARGPAGEIPADDDRPMPPPELITLVNTNPSYAWFSEQGRKEAATLVDLAAKHGRPFNGARVLDFGCGCGRVARWLAPIAIERGGRFHGSDLNPKLIGWCRENLPGDYGVNGLKPPLPLQDGSMDLLYCLSVLTHLKLSTARAWLADFARVLAPGGLAIISFHDEDLAPDEIRPALAHSPWVLTTQVLEGSNLMGAFTTRAFFVELCAPYFEVLEVAPSDPAGGHQALAVVRRR